MGRQSHDLCGLVRGFCCILHSFCKDRHAHKPNNYESDTTDWTDVENGGSITITNTLPKDDTPGTGDNSQIKLWLAMTLTSAAGLGGMLWLALRRKKREEN